MLVASIANPQDLERAAHLADLCELRADQFPLEVRPKGPWILTVRKKAQGGALKISEKKRFKLIETLLELGPDYLDLEADTNPCFIEKIAIKYPQIRLIGSYHNFHETPQDLEALFSQMRNPHFAIYKMALTAQSTLDMLRLMIFLQKTKIALCAISMGECGKASRVMGKICGSYLSYAGLREDPQLRRYSLQTLHEVFHFSKLNRKTKIYALLGDPVEQSPGHIFHNDRFAQNAVYIKLKLLEKELPEFFQLVKKLPFAGFSVTRPLKEAICPYMDELSVEAQAMGAVNTVTIRDGKFFGTNTDGVGALNVIEKHLSVRGKQVAILGAGGTAKAIAYEAKLRGAEVTIYNRSREKGEKMGFSSFSLQELKGSDVLINTIPVATVFPKGKTLALDVVYAPRETPFLQEAAKLGCKCIYGEEMFIEQALLQQLQWRY
jgi:3-dehydroquinate dehydratase/shikimate dehydrogenase